MTDSGQSLLEKLEAHIAGNLHNEQFGVEQLAEMMGMSRSHLHRKLHKIKGKSISRFIREYRLEAARKMLIEKEMTASEVSHAVGFGSPSYFNKCFTEYFGYSPGKARLKVGQEITRNTESKTSKNKIFLWLSGLAAAILVGFLIFSQNKKEVIVAETAPEEKSIIVLPFKNLSSDEENQYLADGMVDAISRHLSEIGELKVLSSSASGELTSVKEIGEKLEVVNVLQGSIQRQDSLLRVEIKLINTSDEKQLWAENYDRKVFDALLVQSEIAQRVAKIMKVKLSSKEKGNIEKRTSYSPEAYDNFLKGWYNFNQFSQEGQQKAFKYFEKAISVDSTLASAYLGMAMYYQVKASVWGAEFTVEEAFSKAKPYLDKTLELDPELKEGYGWKAFERLFGSWDFRGSEENYKISIESKFPVFLALYANFLHYENRHAEGFEIADRLNREYPYYPNNQMLLSYYYNKKYEEGLEFMKTRLKLYSNYYTYDTAGFFSLNTGDYDRAISLFQKAIDLEGNRFPRMLSWMGAANAHKGETQKAQELLNELKTLKEKTDAGSPAFFIAIIHSALGEKQEALKWLKTSIDDHEMEVPWLVSEPQLYPLHGMPEFDALVKQVGFREHAYPVELPTHFQ